MKQVAQVRRGSPGVGDGQEHGRTAIMPEWTRGHSVGVRPSSSRALNCEVALCPDLQQKLDGALSLSKRLYGSNGQ
jgi:hypothetical protein